MSNAANKPEMAYVGRKRCGCAVAALMLADEDSTADRRQTAKELARWLRDGYTVEQHDVDWVRENIRRCVHGVKPAQVPLTSHGPAAPGIVEALATELPCQHPGITRERVKQLLPGHSLICLDCGDTAQNEFPMLPAGADALVPKEPA